MLLPVLLMCWLALAHARQESEDSNCNDIDFCKECTHNGDIVVCTECNDDKYVKTDKNGETECVASNECGAGYYPYPDLKECKDCPSPCHTCTGSALTQCTACNEGYFLKLNGDQKTGQCVQCSYTDNSQWLGVKGCVKCNNPESAGNIICTECAKGLYLHTRVDNSAGDRQATSCVEKCPRGYYGKTEKGNKGTCTPCKSNGSGGLANCEECSFDRSLTCTKCSADTYLYIAQTGTSCLTRDKCNEKATYFPKDDNTNGNKCIPCSRSQEVPKCFSCSATAKSTAITCIDCFDGYEVSEGGKKCELQVNPDCPILGCQTCSRDKATCTECLHDHKTIPSKTACVRECPPGTYADYNNCLYCSAPCATCATKGEHACTSCPPGKVLKYDSDGSPTVGRCVQECTVGVDNCKACDAKIGGTRYCSQCENGHAPRNGECFPSGEGNWFCLEPGVGTCTRCDSGFFPLGGGCYETHRQPGSSVCIIAGTSTCEVCANGRKPQNGICSECPGNCVVCPAGTCTACYPGFYLSDSSCVSCAANSDKIVGIPNCTSCSPPPSGTGPVTCYSDSGSNSNPETNKAGLDSGSIAGISVAAVLVVGGVVGFLCWWLLVHKR